MVSKTENRENTTKQFIEQAGESVEKLINQYLGNEWKRARSEGICSGELFVLNIYLTKKDLTVVGFESDDKKNGLLDLR